MNKEDTDKFKDKVEELIRTSLVETGQVWQEKFLLKLCSYAVEQSRIYIPIRDLSLTHGTGINGSLLIAETTNALTEGRLSDLHNVLRNQNFEIVKEEEIDTFRFIKAIKR